MFSTHGWNVIPWHELAAAKIAVSGGEPRERVGEPRVCSRVRNAAKRTMASGKCFGSYRTLSRHSTEAAAEASPRQSADRPGQDPL